jgi:hypothetical protein
MTGYIVTLSEAKGLSRSVKEELKRGKARPSKISSPLVLGANKTESQREAKPPNMLKGC